MENQKGKIEIIDASLLVAGLSALSYLIVYQFEKSYLRYFGFTDLGLISISISNLVSVLSITFLVVFFTVTVYHGVLANLRIVDHPILKVASRNLHLFFGIGFLYIALGHDYLSTILILLALLLSLLYIVPIFTYSRIKGYKNKLNEMMNRYENSKKIQFSNFVQMLLKGDLFSLLVTIIFCYWLATMLGTYSAKSQNEYYVTEVKNVEYAVIRMYSSENALLIPTKNKKSSSTEFLFLKLVGDNENQFVIRKKKLRF